jgi:hypothetical protein
MLVNYKESGDGFDEPDLSFEELESRFEGTILPILQMHLKPGVFFKIGISSVKNVDLRTSNYPIKDSWNSGYVKLDTLKTPINICRIEDIAIRHYDENHFKVNIKGGGAGPEDKEWVLYSKTANRSPDKTWYQKQTPEKKVKMKARKKARHAEREC